MPTGSVSPFRVTGTVSLASGASSSNVSLAGGGDTIVVTNSSSSIAFVRFGSDSTATASAADMPVLGSSKVILSVNSLITYGAAIIPSGSGTIYFSRGDGSVA
jgi:hypothetical protein